MENETKQVGDVPNVADLMKIFRAANCEVCNGEGVIPMKHWDNTTFLVRCECRKDRSWKWWGEDRCEVCNEIPRDGTDCVFCLRTLRL